MKGVPVLAWGLALVAWAVVAGSMLFGRDAAAANPIKLFAPWDPGYKWDTSRGFYFNPPTHNGVDFNGVYDINGVDIGSDAGKPILAAQDGVVTFAGDENDNYGFKVDIHHGGNVYTRYAHLDSLNVTEGDRVLHGMKVGNNGCTGMCDGPHLHFEVRTGGRWGTPELPTPFDGATMAQGQKFLSHNFRERLEIGYRDADWNANVWPDIGAYEPQLGKWWVARNSTTNSFVSQGVWLNNWGTDAIAGDWRHLNGDFNGDGKTDIAVYAKKPGEWHVAFSNGSAFTAQGVWLNNWAAETASSQWRPFTGDFDGDGKDDIAVYQPATGGWNVARSTGTSFAPYGSPWLSSWGVENQGIYWQNLVADFDADGRDDILVYTPVTGRWFVARSTGSSFSPYASHWLDNWGTDGSSPGSWVGLVGRFAGGDSRADIGVYHPGTGQWFVARNTGSAFSPYGSPWLSGWGTEGGQRWRPFVGDFAGTPGAVDDIGVYAATAGRWFIANNTGSSFAPVNGPYSGAWLDAWAVESYPGHYRTH